MSETKKISVVYLKELYYGDVITDPALDGNKLHTMLASMTRVENIHQDTFKYEEAEPSVTRYKNQLTGQPYRQDKEDGEVQIAFVIGAYDFATKADLQGGEATATSWKRPNPTPDVYKSLVGQSKDGVWVVFPRAAIVARGADTDKAVGLSVAGVAMDSGIEGLSSEYWFDASDVVAGSAE